MWFVLQFQSYSESGKGGTMKRWTDVKSDLLDVFDLQEAA